MQAMGQTRDDLVEPMRGAAVEAVRADLALRAVAAAEDIQVSDEEITAEIEGLANRFNMKAKLARKNLESNFQMPLLISDIRKNKAVTWLTEHATVVDAEGKTIDRALLDVSPSELEDAEESAEMLGLDDDHDHDGHDHDDHDH
jgi:trigger factor